MFRDKQAVLPVHLFKSDSGITETCNWIKLQRKTALVVYICKVAYAQQNFTTLEQSLRCDFSFNYMFEMLKRELFWLMVYVVVDDVTLNPNSD